MKTGFLDNMAPNAQRAFIMTIVLSALAVGIYMFAVVPAQETLSKTQQSLEDANIEKNRIDATLRGTESETERLAAAKLRLEEYRARFLERRLGSYATHAREILDPLAIGAGLVDIDYPETSKRKLPLPDPKNQKSPMKLHERIAIRMTARGSYQAAVSFILQTEAALPLVSIQSIKITSNTSDIKRQQLDVTFEWPTEGPDDTPPANKGGAR